MKIFFTLSSYYVQKVLIYNLIWFQIISILLLLFFIIQFWLKNIQIETDKIVGIFVGLLSLIYTVNSSYFQNKKIFKELFDKFNKRYDRLNEDLNLLSKFDEKFIRELSSEVKDKNEKIMNDYLNLCAEEYYWFRRGMIDSEVWDNWFSGICYFLTKPVFKDIIGYENENFNKDSYYGFLKYYQNKKRKIV